MVGIMNASHSNLNLQTFAGIEAFDESGKISVHSREWIRVLFRPVLANDLDFKTAPVNINAANDGAFMGFAIQAPAGLPQTYEFEFYAINEYQGPAVRHKVVSPIDTVGADAAHTVMLASETLQKPHVENPALPATAVAATHAVVTQHSSSSSKKSSGSSDVGNTINRILNFADKGAEVVARVAEVAAMFA